MAADPFEDVLNLEDRFYDEGYQEGLVDGAKAGKVEGRSVGMTKGFEKFFESGRLYGKALIWANRLPKRHREDGPSPSIRPQDSTAQTTCQACTLPPLQHNARLEKNIATLCALVEPNTLSTENTDEAVDDFDDRVRRAHGKAKIVERMTGEGPVAGASIDFSVSAKEGT